jgi:putative oxidoreductase
MASGLLFLRLIAAATLFAHGTSKLLGWWGGRGPQGAAGAFASWGFRKPLASVLFASISETAGAVALALGFGTPFACVAGASVLVVAAWVAHLPRGFFGLGLEFPILFWAVFVSLASTGPGRYSIDHAAGWSDNLSGPLWGLGVAVLSAVGGVLVLSTRARLAAAPTSNAPVAS